MNASVGATDGANLTLLGYNDSQTAVADNESMGTLVGGINDRTAAVDGPTLVGGDEVSPSPLSVVSQWEVPVEVMSLLDPAAEVVGSHDLDYGFDAVGEFDSESEFPWLVANIRSESSSGVPGTRNYTVVERGEVTVGSLGLVDDAINPKTEGDFGEEAPGHRLVGSRE